MISVHPPLTRENRVRRPADLSGETSPLRETQRLRLCFRAAEAHPLAEASSRVSGRARPGLIPAHAGKTEIPVAADASSAHPAHAGKTHCTIRRARCIGLIRSRGKAPSASRGRVSKCGSSPLAGKTLCSRARSASCRLIPTQRKMPDLRFYCADRSDLGNPSRLAVSLWKLLSLGRLRSFDAPQRSGSGYWPRQPRVVRAHRGV